MNICVLGLWHLGSVTAVCLAALGHRVVGLDADEQRIAYLNAGKAPVYEPDLQELLQRELCSGNVHFAATVEESASAADVLWVACDTPIGADGEGRPQRVLAQLERVLPALRAGTLVLISSQLPVGSTRRLQQRARILRGGESLLWAYLPENLRLGTAVADFLHPDRIVAGVATAVERELLEQLLGPIGAPVEWMSIESAEMAKHALNAFLAVSVTFANELACICEVVGADAAHVERALKSDRRIGPHAYLAPGAAFAGGTLARDVSFLSSAAAAHDVATPLLGAILPSNAAHRLWAQKTLRRLLSDLAPTTIAVWGLTYKPGTDTLRGSAAVELCDWLLQQGARVRVHDPAVRSLPRHWSGRVERSDSPLAAVHGANALVLATPWPLYREIGAEQLIQAAGRLLVLDAARFLPHLATRSDRLGYFAVGMPGKPREH